MASCTAGVSTCYASQNKILRSPIHKTCWQVGVGAAAMQQKLQVHTNPLGKANHNCRELQVRNHQTGEGKHTQHTDDVHLRSQQKPFNFIMSRLCKLCVNLTSSMVIYNKRVSNASGTPRTAGCSAGLICGPVFCFFLHFSCLKGHVAAYRVYHCIKVV